MKTNVKQQEIQISTYGHNKAACLQRGDPISTIDAHYIENNFEIIKRS